jgi:putative addiction module component (TIGR02574 family)
MSFISADSLLQQALDMPENERARLAEKLISSLHEQPSREIDEAWHREIERRIQEIDSGKVVCVPWEDIRNRLYRNAADENYSAS